SDGAMTTDIDRDQWRGLPAAAVSDAMERLGAMDAGISLLAGEPLVGPAYTVQTAAGDNATIHRALESAPAGGVLVIDAGGHLGRAVWGAVLTAAARQLGLLGVVVDGAVRDITAIRESGFVVYGRGVCPAGPHKGFQGRIGGTVQCGGVPVTGGDLVVGDADGVVVVPQGRTGEVLAATRAQLKTEEEWLRRIGRGEPSARLLGVTTQGESRRPRRQGSAVARGGAPSREAT
ncbi:MAG: RraA family protein, partial [Egibacteraceae bacterium]